MLVPDLLHSCAHASVAEAAVSSIGGEFAQALQNEARARGLSVGVLAAGFVQTFARDASPGDWRGLADAVRGKDFPVLSGLEAILNHSCGRGRTGVRPALLPVAVMAADRESARYAG
jgi:hypothetical protein